MPDIPVIAPNARAFAEAGGCSFDRMGAGRPFKAVCGFCGEWDDVAEGAEAEFTRKHALDHDAIRPSVLGIDPSLRRAGVAIVSQVPEGLGGGAWPSLIDHRGEDGHNGATYYQRGDRLVRQVRALMGIVDRARLGGADIRLAAIEGMIPGMSVGHAFDRGGLWWSIFAGLRSRGIPIAVVTPAHREKFIAGVSLRPNAKTGMSTPEAKRRIVDETRARWAFPNGPELVREFIPRRLNHDQADALGLADMAALHLKLGVPWRPRRRHVENIALVDWPEAA